MALPHMPIAVICALLVIAIWASLPFRAAEGALLPDILDDEPYLVANGLRMMTDQLAQLAGFSLGGLAVAFIGARGGLAIDAATFLVSAALIRTFVARRPAPTASTTAARDSAGASTRGALRLLATNPVVRSMVGLGLLAGFFIAPEGVAPAYAATVGGGAVRVGLLLTSIAAGCVAGTYLWVRVVPPRHQQSLLGPLAVATGLPLVACALQPNFAISLVLWSTSGVFSAYQVLAATRLIQEIPAHRRGQIIGLTGSIMITVQGAGVLGVGALVHAIGAPGAVALAGALGSVLALPLAISWARVPAEVAGRYFPRHQGLAKHRGAQVSRHARTTAPAAKEVI